MAEERQQNDNTNYQKETATTMEGSRLVNILKEGEDLHYYLSKLIFTSPCLYFIEWKFQDKGRSVPVSFRFSPEGTAWSFDESPGNRQS
jgi:hypothetical protein